ncbi:MAG: CDP-alcohol phosphatidyltransferase family protein, partial [Elusimicrobiales bacterium]
FFDCLDGGIARVMNTRNSYGRFLDSIMWWADMVFWVAVGVTVWRMPELRLFADSRALAPGIWLAAGAACALLADYAAYLDSVFDLALRSPWEKLVVKAAPTATPLEGKAGPEFFARVTVHNLRVRETHYLLLAAAAVTGSVDLLLGGMTVFYAIVVLLLLAVYCGRGKKVRAAELGEKS